MAITREKLAETLAELGRKLTAIAEQLAEEQPSVVPLESVMETVREKKARRECLQCGDIFPQSERMRVGCCNTCYINSLDRIAAGETTRAQLELAGLFAKPERGGRPQKRTKLDEFLEGGNARSDSGEAGPEES